MDSALSALQVAAGVSPDKLSLVIRTILFVGILVWGAWCVYGQIHHYHHHQDADFLDTYRGAARIALVVILMSTLVYIV
jgi:integrating conjugative element protein (TIGR03758 family)